MRLYRFDKLSVFKLCRLFCRVQQLDALGEGVLQNGGKFFDKGIKKTPDVLIFRSL